MQADYDRGWDDAKQQDLASLREVLLGLVEVGHPNVSRDAAREIMAAVHGLMAAEETFGPDSTLGDLFPDL